MQSHLFPPSASPMTPFSRPGVRSALLLALLVAACDRAPTAEPSDVRSGLASGLHLLLAPVEHDRGGEEVVGLYLHAVDTPARAASLQGEMSFDTDGARLLGAELADGLAGTWHEAAPGRVRFSLAVRDGRGELGSGPLLRLRFAPGARLGSAHLAAEELIGTDAATELTGLVVTHAPALVSATPLP